MKSVLAGLAIVMLAGSGGQSREEKICERAWSGRKAYVVVSSYGLGSKVSQSSLEDWLKEEAEILGIEMVFGEETVRAGGSGRPVFRVWLTFSGLTETAYGSAYRNMGAMSFDVQLIEMAKLNGMEENQLISSWNSGYAMPCLAGDEKEMARLSMRLVATSISRNRP